MKHLLLPFLSLVLTTALTSPLTAADAISASADQVLRAMSAKLAGARQFSFHAKREIDAGLLEGVNLPEKANIAVSVSRPNQLAAVSVSRKGTRRFIADGRKLTLLDGKMNHYAQIPMRTSLDGLVAALDEKYGFTPPLAEFALSNPYKDIRQQAHTITDLGIAKVGAGFLGLGGTPCHHLALTGNVADAELWIAVGDQLPRKLVATFKNLPGQPQLRITFSAWNLAAPVSAADFTFVPPPGSQKIEMWTTAKMQAASKN